MIICSKCNQEIPAGTKFCPACGQEQVPDLAPAEDALKGDSLFEKAINSKGRYQIKRLLGRGGMGMVYHAFDSELGIEVAIKSLPPEVSNDPRGLSQLKQEAKLSMQLTHQNIVRLYDLKEAENNKYLVMEYVPGFNLSEYLLVRGRLREEEAWDILKHVAAALDYAHSQKVIHRDIKPGNILFKTTMTPEQFADYYARENQFPPGAEIKVADFGIARTVSDSISRMSNMPVSGTLSYMSREQVRGKPQTHKTDIYSLAVVAYELLNGNPPFHQGEITYQILNEEPEPIEGVKQEYMLAILRALKKEAEKRPDSVTEFIELAEKYRKDPGLYQRETADQAGEQTQPLPQMTPMERNAQRIAQQKLPYFTIIAVTAILGLFVIGFFTLRSAREKSRGQEKIPLGQTGAKPAEIPAIKSSAEMLWKVGRNAPGVAHRGKVNAVAISPSGNIVASAGQDQVIKLWNASDGSLIKNLKGHSDEINALAFSPGGSKLASAAGDGKIKFWTVPGGELAKTIDSGMGVNSVRFSPDGQTLASAAFGVVKLWSVSSGEQVKSFKAPLLMSISSVAISPDGKMLAASGSNYIINVWDLKAGKIERSIYGPVPTSSANAITFSPGGGLIAVAGSDKQVKLWNSYSGKSAGIIEAHAKTVTALDWSASGNLATVSTDGKAKIWAPHGMLIARFDNLSASSVSFVGDLFASAGCPNPGENSCDIGEVRLFKIKLQP